MLLLCLLVSAFNAQDDDTYDYTMDVELLWDISNEYSSTKWLSWGIFYDHAFHEERLWVKQDTSIDKYEVSPSGAVKVGTLPSGSECTSSSTSLYGNKFISTHGQDVYCTCEWSADNPCPHKLLVEDPSNQLESQYEGKIQFSGNTVLHTESIYPDVTGTFGVAEPWNACSEILNPEDIQGKYCLVTRGSCYFQTKWDMCNQAGAIGTIVTNLNDNLGWYMWVTSVTTPMIVIAQSEGVALKDSYRAAGNTTNIQLTVGRSTGVDSPDPAYSSPDPLVMVNYYTGQKTEDKSIYFTTALSFMYNMHNDYGYFYGVDSTSPPNIVVLDMDQSPPTYKGNFTLGQDGNHFFIYQDDKSYMLAADAWENSLKLYDMNDGINPTFVSEWSYQPCSDDEIMGEIFIHPNNRILYVAPSIIIECSIGIHAYDISNPVDVVKLSSVNIPEVEMGASLNTVNFGPENIAALGMSSAGISWYDFTDPLNPTPVAHIDISEAANTYTLGVINAQYGLDGTWYVWDYTEDWHNFHAMRLVAKEDEGGAATDCDTGDDDDNSIFDVLTWVFLVLLIITTCGCVYFYWKVETKMNFQFAQMQDDITSLKREPGVKNEGMSQTAMMEMATP